ncbi:rab-GTPase-TBC domain-containing protein [Calycina marina]|uniref:Rab-GTPase-TBC domain-containing protein n=1 Tax=Calycina marina TaxID=1763456 RepID=A0A9P7Z2U6_9HELO|nr:rab-GTPase-TBC domain-containing protein [Calycina marina]
MASNSSPTKLPPTSKMSSRPSTPSLLPPPNPLLHAPPSPNSHRALRRLKSAHTLGQTQPSLISQQHRQALQRNASPVKKDTPARTRSNSDVTNMAPPVLETPVRRPLTGRKSTTEMLSIDKLIRDGPPDEKVQDGLEALRLKILAQGIKSDSDGMSSLRIYVWLILLNAPIIPTDEYLALIHRGASPAYSKIRNDTFRTLTSDVLFRRRVSEASLIRLLNALAWKLHDAREEKQGRLSFSAMSDQSSPEPSSAMKSRARALTLTTEGSDAGASEPGTYVQGMNVLAAPFLYAARSEAEAFIAFHRFITHECPGYVRGAMDGVHKGLALVDKVLGIVDSKLSNYLMSKGMNAELYAFPSVLTLCACTPPLPEVLRLWDFLFAYGAHLNILCIVAQLVILRNSILSSPSPTKILRNFPAINAEMVIQLTLSLIKKIPDDVYAEIVVHAK